MKIKVPGMMCMHCVKSISDTMNSMDDVFDVQVDLDTKLVTLQAKDGLQEKILSAIDDLGFDAEVIE